ncbi:putative membrane protein [Bradyrhizobium sp. USDA 4518]
MSLAPLLDAAPAIPLHAFAAMAAFVLGSIQLAAPKGTLPHRTLQIQLVGPWSPIHLLSIFSLAMLALGVTAARSHNVRRHRFTMIGIFFGALLIAGLFTLMPGRIMHAVVFGH